MHAKSAQAHGEYKRLLSRYEETTARLNKIENAGYKVVSMWECEFKKLISQNPGLEKELSSHPCLKNSPLNIRDAMYGGRKEATKTLQNSAGGKINHVDVISLYPYVCTFGKIPVGHPKVYVGASCPLTVWIGKV